MANYRATGWNDNLNLLVFVQLLMVAIALAWLGLNDVPVGVQYTTLFLVGIGLAFLSFLFIKEDSRVVIKEMIRSPFTTSTDVAVGMYVLGWLLPILITLLLALGGSAFHITSFMVPLEAGRVNENIQSLNAASVSASPFWQFFVTVFGAGGAEEFVFGFVLPLAFSLVGIWLYTMLWAKKGGSPMDNKWFFVGFAIVMSALLFGGAHSLNKTYVGVMFLVAILFRLIMNVGIYFWALFLSFTIGYHQANNAVWFAQQYGWNAVLSALGSLPGVILLAYFAIVLIYLFRRWGDVWSKTRDAIGI